MINCPPSNLFLHYFLSSPVHRSEKYYQYYVEEVEGRTGEKVKETFEELCQKYGISRRIIPYKNDVSEQLEIF